MLQVIFNFVFKLKIWKNVLVGDQKRVWLPKGPWKCPNGRNAIDYIHIVMFQSDATLLNWPPRQQSAMAILELYHTQCITYRPSLLTNILKCACTLRVRLHLLRVKFTHTHAHKYIHALTYMHMHLTTAASYVEHMERYLFYYHFKCIWKMYKFVISIMSINFV